ncbi:kinase-like domain-containing protein [Rhizophagus irregularis DAOM 181602=DAOM 197198]|nr:kinase-like domain-containing protein [Rhizophagus irregularis DAOM 181602=DAOM 197198]
MHKLKSLFNKLNVSNKDSNSINATIAKTDVITENHQSSNKQELNEASLNKNCSYCNKPFTEELWCKECDHRRKIEGWTSGNNDVDKFIKDTIYDARNTYKESLKWVPFGRFKDVKQIGVGGFAKVYSATWIDHGIKVALKRLNGSKNMSAVYLNELKIHWNFYKEDKYQEEEKFGYKGKEIEAMFEEADKEIPNISTSYEKNPDAIYTSRLFTFNNLTKPINSSLITSYLDDEENNKDCQDSQLFDLEVSSSLQLKGSFYSKQQMMLIIKMIQLLNDHILFILCHVISITGQYLKKMHTSNSIMDLWYGSNCQ